MAYFLAKTVKTIASRGKSSTRSISKDHSCSKQIFGKAADLTTAKEIAKFSAKQRPITIRENATIKQMVTMIHDDNIGALLVTDSEGDEITGIVSERDVVRTLAKTTNLKEFETFQVRSIMTSKDNLIS